MPVDHLLSQLLNSHSRVSSTRYILCEICPSKKQLAKKCIRLSLPSPQQIPHTRLVEAVSQDKDLGIILQIQPAGEDAPTWPCHKWRLCICTLPHTQTTDCRFSPYSDLDVSQSWIETSAQCIMFKAIAGLEWGGYMVTNHVQMHVKHLMSVLSKLVSI